MTDARSATKPGISETAARHADQTPIRLDTNGGRAKRGSSSDNAAIARAEVDEARSGTNAEQSQQKGNGVGGERTERRPAARRGTGPDDGRVEKPGWTRTRVAR